SWKVFTLARVLSDLKSGFAYGKHYATKEGIPQLRPYNIDTDGRLDLSQFKFVPNNFTRLKEHLLVDGDILFNNTNSPKLVGKSTVFREHAPYVYSNHMTRLRVNPSKASPDYVQKFLHLLWTQRIFEEQCQQWVNQAAINAARLLRTLIPLPPLEEQSQIAEILELADELRRKRKVANQLIDKIIHSLFLDMFGDPTTNPKGWEVKKLEELLERNDSGTWGSSPEGKNDSFPVIRSTEITHDGQLVPSTAAIRHVRKIKALKYELRDGDLIVVKSSGSPHLIGRCAEFYHPGDDRQYLFSNFVQRLRPHPQKVTPKYLQLLLNSDYAKEHIARSQSTTSGLRNLSMKHYVTMLVPVPPLFLQQRFAELVSQFEEKHG
ncbi:unnamed protein product, partial [marine sediment metagenome]